MYVRSARMNPALEVYVNRVAAVPAAPHLQTVISPTDIELRPLLVADASRFFLQAQPAVQKPFYLVCHRRRRGYKPEEFPGLGQRLGTTAAQTGPYAHRTGRSLASNHVWAPLRV